MLNQKGLFAIPEDDWLTINETAVFLKISERTVRRFKADCLIIPIYIGGSVYFSKAAVHDAAINNKLNTK